MDIWVALVGLFITSLISPAVALWLKNLGERQQRLDAAQIAKEEKQAAEAREDAREARAERSRAVALAAIEQIKKQTDGVLTQVAELAKSTGRVEGGAEATKAAEGTAATLALGQQQGRDAERESIATKLKHDSDQPVPVADTRTAEGVERLIDATESKKE